MKAFQRYGALYLLMLLGCVKPYEPAVFTGVNNFLVVDGIINSGSNAVTTIAPTRTRALNDAVMFFPELQAQIFIEDQNGSRFFLQGTDNGLYVSQPLTLNRADRYRLNITTTAGSNYVSDFVPVKRTPAIDRVSWQQQGDTILFSLSTHDAQNSTRYYRWTYEEDWEYAAFYDTNLAFQGGKVVFLSPSEQTFRCWKHLVSTNIILHTTVQLDQDIVLQEPLLQLPAQSPKLERRYSLLARQFALTKEAFEYWQVLQKNTEQLGGLFGAQPSQLIGNIYNSKQPEEPVIGFVSAATSEEHRIFIRRSEVANGYSPVSSCEAFSVPGSDPEVYLKNNPEYVPAYYTTGGLMLSTPRCVDCRLAGGTTVKPPFWP